MKKKLLALMATLCMVFSLVGCSSEGLALMKEFDEVANWEATNQAGTMAFDFAMGETKANLTLDYTAYTVTDTLQMEMIITPKSVQADSVTIDLTKGDYKISPVKMYLDGAKAYLSTSYFTDLFKIAGVEATDVATEMPGLDLTKEYIGFDLTEVYADMGIDMKDIAASNEKINEEFYAELGKADLKFPIKQEGRKYTIELTADQMVEAFAKAFAQSMESSKDIIVAEYKAMGLTDEEIAMIMEQFNAITTPETLASITEMLKGSTAKAVLTYEDGKQTTEYAMNFNIAVDETQSVALKFTMKDVATKAEAKAVTMPTNAKVYTMEEFMALATATPEAEAAVEVEATEVTPEAPQATEKPAA